MEMMNKFKKLKKQKGFTLVELLIVLVILGILAATIVPRMVAQTRGAEIAEATNMLGAIKRVAVSICDQAGGGANFPVFDTTAGMGAGSAWADVLGMSALPAQAKFDYEGDAAGVLTATAKVGGGTVSIDANTGVYTCGAPYAAIPGNQGCR